MSQFQVWKAAGLSRGGRSRVVLFQPWAGWVAGASMVSVASMALAQNSGPLLPPVGTGFGSGIGGGFPPIATPSFSTPDFSDLSVTGPSGTAEPARDLGALYDVTLTRDLPYVPAPSRPQRAYNFKFRNTTIQLGASLATAYSDNALQGSAGSGQDDFTVTPAINIGMDAPLSADHSFRIDVGVGYRYSVNFSELNSLYITPRSVIDYRIRIGDVMVTFFDQLSTTVDSFQRVDLRANGTAAGVDFARLNNTAGVSTAYSLSRDTSLVGGYSFGLDRGLSDAYGNFDSNTHSLNAALYHRLRRQLTVGLAGSYNITEFQQSTAALSNSDGWSVGPLLAYRPSEFLNFSASVRYTSIQYERIGGVFAASNPATVTFDLNATHQINRYLSHTLSGGRYFNNSLSSAQMETLAVNYGLSWRAFRNSAINAGVGWQNFKQSGNTLAQLFPSRDAAIAALTGLPQNDGTLITPAEAASIYDFYSFSSSGDAVSITLSTSYQFTRKLVGSLAYSHILRTSEVGGGAPGGYVPEFNANVVSLNLGYRF